MDTLPPNAALLAIDMQRGFDDPAWGPRNNPEAEGKVAALLAAWRAAAAPVIHVHHDSSDPASPLRRGAAGNAPKPEAAPRRGERLYRKTVNSAFIGTRLDANLRERGIDTLVIAGLTSNHCVSTTARMAGNLGYATFVAADATAAFARPGLDGMVRSAEAVHDAALGDLQGEFAQVVTTAWLIAAIAAAAPASRPRRTRLAAARTALALTAAAIAGALGASTASADGAAARQGDDFYRYANGAWLAATTIPPSEARVDTSIMLRAQNALWVRGLLDGGDPGRADLRKARLYYRSLTDHAAIEARGLTPLAADLAAIAAIADRHALAVWLGQTTRLDDGTNQQTESLFGIWVHQGFHDPHHYAVHVMQGGLGLAAGDYTDVAAAAAHRARVARTLQAAGYADADARAGRVVALEAAIAATHASRADTDDVFKTDNSWRREDFTARAPGIDWSAWLDGAGLSRAQRFVVWQPGAVTGSARLVATVPLETWRDYLTFHLITHFAPVLSAALRDGPAPDPIAATEAVFGDAIGRAYVAQHFPPRAKAAADAMIETIRAALRQRLLHEAWLSPATRRAALAKLAALDVGLGFPERWIDYAPLTIIAGDALGNRRRAEAFAYARAVARLGRPVDPREWADQVHPQQVAGLLQLSPNAMQFTAGLLQPPYFDPGGDRAANYGSAGAGIAHEIAHSFDEVGNIYDAPGRLGRWWTPADAEHYRALTAPLAAQLDRCMAAPGVATHGQQVLGESVADLAGLAAAYDAYHAALHGRPDVIRGGLTGDQRFFIAFAQRWRRLQTDAALRAQVAGDTHAPPACRANLVRNMDAWVRAFGVRPGDALYLPPAARIRVW